MNEELIKQVVLESIQNYISSVDNKCLEIDEDTNLIGEKSILDSLGLVNVLVDLEVKLNEIDLEICFISEKAMSLENSPFKNVKSLMQFILGEGK